LNTSKFLLLPKNKSYKSPSYCSYIPYVVIILPSKNTPNSFISGNNIVDCLYKNKLNKNARNSFIKISLIFVILLFLPNLPNLIRLPFFVNCIFENLPTLFNFFLLNLYL